MNDRQTVQLGSDARQLLDNEAFKQAMSTLRNSVIEEWKLCPVRDKEGQLILLQLAKLTDKFEGILSGIVETGKFAKHSLDMQEIRSESKGRQLLNRFTG